MEKWYIKWYILYYKNYKLILHEMFNVENLYFIVCERFLIIDYSLW